MRGVGTETDYAQLASVDLIPLSLRNCRLPYKVDGPSLVEPSPQRMPLIYQAGTSSAGVAFAGRHAEAVFLMGPNPKTVRVPSLSGAHGAKIFI